MRCKSSNTKKIVEMEEGLMFFIWYKSITQVKGIFLSYNYKIDDVVWDRVLNDKE